MDNLTNQVDKFMVAFGRSECDNKTWRAQVERKGKEEREAFEVKQNQKQEQAERTQTQSTEMVVGVMKQFHQSVMDRLDSLDSKSEQMPEKRQEGELPSNSPKDAFVPVSRENQSTLLRPVGVPNEIFLPKSAGVGKGYCPLREDKPFHCPKKAEEVNLKETSAFGMRSLSKEEWGREKSNQEFSSSSPGWLKVFEKSDLNYIFSDPFQVDAAGGENNLTSVNEYLVYGSTATAYKVALATVLNISDLMSEGQRAKKRLVRELLALKVWLINFYRCELKLDATEENVKQTQVYLHQVRVAEEFKTLMDNILAFYHSEEGEKGAAMAVIVQIFVFLQSVRKERAAALKGHPHARILVILQGLKVKDIIFNPDGLLRNKNDSMLPLLVNQEVKKLEVARIASVVNGLGKNVGGGGGSGGNGVAVVTFNDKKKLVVALFAEFSQFKHAPQPSPSLQAGGKRNNGCILCGSVLGSHVGNFGPHTFSHCPKRVGEKKEAVLEDLLNANAAILAKHAVTKDLARAYFNIVT